MSKKKPLAKPLSLRLSSEVRECVKKLGEDTGLIQAQLYDLILRAGCKALVEFDDENVQLPLPLRFKVVKGDNP